MAADFEFAMVSKPLLHADVQVCTRRDRSGRVLSSITRYEYYRLQNNDNRRYSYSNSYSNSMGDVQHNLAYISVQIL